MRRLGIAIFWAATSVLLSGCWRILYEAGQYAVDHSIGVKAGPCPPFMDSVKTTRGAPYRTYRSDVEDVANKTQVFWHEWGYRIPADSGGTRKDSVTVVGFLWGEGVHGCDVIERREKVPGRYGPWENAGDLPVREDTDSLSKGAGRVVAISFSRGSRRSPPGESSVSLFRAAERSSHSPPVPPPPRCRTLGDHTRRATCSPRGRRSRR